MRGRAHLLLMLLPVIAVTLLGRALPTWTLSLATIAASNALVALGIVVLARTGNVSFGQGLFFAASGAKILFRSEFGLASLAVRENNLRAEYLGISANRVIAINFVIAAAFAGASGAFSLMAQRHIDPQFAYWTTSGEFVFVAVLAGNQSVAAVFVASMALELVRSFSNLYLPNTWQLVLGVFLLGVILFLPRGIGSLWVRSKRGKARPAISTEREMVS